MFWNKVKVVLIVIGALRTIPKCLLKGLEKYEVEGRTVSTQTTALLRLLKLLWRVLVTYRDFL